MAQFDPSEAGVEDVLDHLKKADRKERDRVLALEVAGKKRKTVLEPYGVDPDARYDEDGRKLYPWEAVGKQKADYGQEEPEEDEDAKAQREAQNEQEQRAAAATPQLGGSPAGSGTAPAAQAAGTGAGGASTTATAAGGSTPA